MESAVEKDIARQEASLLNTNIIHRPKSELANHLYVAHTMQIAYCPLWEYTNCASASLPITYKGFVLVSVSLCNCTLPGKSNILTRWHFAHRTHELSTMDA